MRLISLTLLTMIAFAANSLLNRAALAGGYIGPADFAAIRLAAGAACLLFILALRQRGTPRPQRPNLPAIAGLTAYILGFSFAYVSLDAGVGALILFGGVQVTMFAGAVIGGERPPMARWAGMSLSMAGLALMVWPATAGPVPFGAMALMGVAAAGWGVYSLIGRTAKDAVAATAWNFAYGLPLALAAALILADATPATGYGIGLAVVSGAITSGMGYALWYAILPRLGATTAALAQLSVPVIALALGAALLAEPLTARALLAAALVLGGIALGVLWPRRAAAP